MKMPIFGYMPAPLYPQNVEPISSTAPPEAGLAFGRTIQLDKNAPVPWVVTQSEQPSSPDKVD